MTASTLDRLAGHAIVPVVEIDETDHAVPLALALRDAGLPAMEITLRTHAGLDAIRAVREAAPDVLVGAGTILEPHDVDAVMRAGAEFGVSPGLGTAARHAVARDLAMVPGVVTPSEVMAALELGLTHVKFFPASAYGGAPAVRALGGPFARTGVSFMPTGGIRAETVDDYLSIPSVFAVGGTWIAPRHDIRHERWDAIRERAAAAARLVAHRARMEHA